MLYENRQKNVYIFIGKNCHMVALTVSLAMGVLKHATSCHLGSKVIELSC